MRTHTGGKVAFWYHAADPAVVYFGDEGQLDVLALNFDEFLKGAVLGKSGVHDLDDSEPRLRVPGVQGKPSKAGLAALQKKFDAWWKQNKAMLEPKTDSEALRQKLHAAGAQMFADGKSKVWRPGSDWWSLKFRIERIAGKLSVGIFERGKATPVPRKYNFLPLVEELLTLVKNKQKAAYELSISSYGGVSVDSDRELLLLSVEQAAKSAKIFAEGAQRKK